MTIITTTRTTKKKQKQKNKEQCIRQDYLPKEQKRNKQKKTPAVPNTITRLTNNTSQKKE